MPGNLSEILQNLTPEQKRLIEIKKFILDYERMIKEVEETGEIKNNTLGLHGKKEDIKKYLEKKIAELIEEREQLKNPKLVKEETPKVIEEKEDTTLTAKISATRIKEGIKKAETVPFEEIKSETPKISIGPTKMLEKQKELDEINNKIDHLKEVLFNEKLNTSIHDKIIDDILELIFKKTKLLIQEDEEFNIETAKELLKKSEERWLIRWQLKNELDESLLKKLDARRIRLQIDITKLKTKIRNEDLSNLIQELETKTLNQFEKNKLEKPKEESSATILETIAPEPKRENRETHNAIENSDYETKRRDIEKRRKEELENLRNRIALSYKQSVGFQEDTLSFLNSLSEDSIKNIVPDSLNPDNTFRWIEINFKDGTRRVIGNLFYNEKIKTLKDLQLESEKEINNLKNRQNSTENGSYDFVADVNLNEINAKYDAELAELDKQFGKEGAKTLETQKVEQAEIEEQTPETNTEENSEASTEEEWTENDEETLKMILERIKILEEKLREKK